jgi:hypothetical protein
MVMAVIEGTITLVMLYLVLSNADSFNTVATSIGTVYSSAVRTLQAR